MLSQADAAALGARDHVVDGEVAALVAAVLAGPAVAREHRAAGDLAAVGVARDAHVGEQPDDDRAAAGSRLSACSAQLAVLEHLGALLEYQDGGAAHGADVDRLERGVQDKYSAR